MKPVLSVQMTGFRKGYLQLILDHSKKSQIRRQTRGNPSTDASSVRDKNTEEDLKEARRKVLSVTGVGTTAFVAPVPGACMIERERDDAPQGV